MRRQAQRLLQSADPVGGSLGDAHTWCLRTTARGAEPLEKACARPCRWGRVPCCQPSCIADALPRAEVPRADSARLFTLLRARVDPPRRTAVDSEGVRWG